MVATRKWKDQKSHNRYSFVCLTALSMMFSACAKTPVPLATITPLTPTSMVVYAAMTRNYSGTHGVVNIYVDSDGWPNALTPESGQEDHELTATLWFIILGRPETYTSFQVQSGQAIYFEGYEIFVLRIAKDDRGAHFVEVEVAETR